MCHAMSKVPLAMFILISIVLILIFHLERDLARLKAEKGMKPDPENKNI